MDFFSRFRKRKHVGARRIQKKKILTYVGIGAVALVLAGSISVVGLFAWFAKDLPDPDNVRLRNIPQTTKIYDRTGHVLLYEIHGGEKRTIVSLDQIAQDAKDATVAGEDKDFYQHHGFDLRGITRALYKNILRGRKAQGGSTITQQFIKNSVLTKEKTYIRKLKEVILAFEMERRFTKDQILKLYLNEIPYGSVAYGIESAAQTFFGKSAKDLTLSESAVLASLPKAPTYYSPYGNRRDELLARSHHIIDLMVEQGYVTAEEAEEAKADDVLARIIAKKETITAPHFVFYVKEQLAEEFGEQTVERGGLKVITTLDAGKQELAEKTIADNKKLLETWGANTAALLSLDAKNGDILSMVGSADYFDETINGNFNATLGLLQPGSSIKPMVYAAAFERGFTPNTVLYDVVTTFQKYPREYRPKNYDLKEHGLVTMREALAGSLNIPAVKTLYLVGVDNFLEYAKKLGYSTFGDRSRFGLSLVLGGGEVRPIEHIAAFSAFAQDGILRPTRAVLRVEDHDGRILIDNLTDIPGKRVMPQEVARQINGILSDNAARAFVFGERNYLTLGGRPVAAKTGTTNDYKDAWSIGYTPSLVTGVWVGNAKGEEMKRGADGSKVAAPLWNAFMKNALADTPVESFRPAAPVTTGKPVLDGDKSAQLKVKIDTVTGKLATQYTPPEFVEERGFGLPHSILFFIDKNDPRGPAPEHPENDPQFELWESAVAEWAKKQNLTFTAPPTEFDDVHIPENVPSVMFISPTDGDTIADRSFIPVMSVSARRGVAKIEYRIDEDLIASVPAYASGNAVTIPNRIRKGFHTLSAKAYDDVGNSASTSITINLIADAGPLNIEWRAPVNYQTISYFGQFPFTVKLTLDDPESVIELRLLARDRATMTEELIGSINEPALPNVSLQWERPLRTGDYDLIVEAALVGGESGRESIMVTLVQ